MLFSLLYLFVIIAFALLTAFTATAWGERVTPAQRKDRRFYFLMTLNMALLVIVSAGTLLTQTKVLHGPLALYFSSNGELLLFCVILSSAVSNIASRQKKKSSVKNDGSQSI